MQTKGVVFDLDGTLVNSQGLILKAFNYALEPWNIKINREDIDRVRNRPAQTLFVPFVGEQSAAEAFKRLAFYSREFVHTVTLYPGIKETISKLKALNIRIGVWTGRDLESAMEILAATGIKQYLSSIVASCNVKKNKPDPEGLKLVCLQLKINPTEIIMVGDHQDDVLPAVTLGVKVVGAGWNPDFTASLPPEQVCKKPPEILDMVSSSR